MNFDLNESYLNLNEVIDQSIGDVKAQASLQGISLIKDYEIRLGDTQTKYHLDNPSLSERKDFFNCIMGDK